MKLARLRYGSSTLLARIDGERATPLLFEHHDQWRDPLRSWLRGYRSDHDHDILSLAHGTLLSPLRSPSKIVAVGLNYREHATEQGIALPSQPLLFAKATSALCNPGDPIQYPKHATRQLDYENELAIIIGEQVQNVSVEHAREVVLGYTICNDITARDIQKSDGQYFRAKSYDTFCPLGPIIVTADEIPDPQNLHMSTTVNGELRQSASTSDMIFGIAEIVSFASSVMTLEPGDIITTGTPPGVGISYDPPKLLEPGDVIECRIEGIGVLRNTVAAKKVT